MDRKVWIGLGIGLVVVCLAAAACLFWVGAWLLDDSSLESVQVQVDAPIEAWKNETMPIEVEIENISSDGVVLDSIDITNSYLAGIFIQTSEPRFIDTFEIPLVDYQSYTFNQEIGPGERLVVRFDAVPVAAGDFGGSMDVCIDSGASCLTYNLRTIVNE